MALRITARRHLGLGVAALLLTGAGAWMGCSASGGGGLGGNHASTGASGGASASGGAGGGGGTTTAGGGLQGTGLGMFNLGGGGSGGAGGESCGATSVAAEKITTTTTETVTEVVTETTPAALYLMQDTSGSMFDKWGYAIDSLTQFVNDPNSTGLNVGLNYFPLALPVSDCSGSSFSTPEVGWNVLGTAGPGSYNQTIVDSLLNHAPFGLGTPIEDALRGAIMGCQNFEAANPDIPCYAVLITDGAPSDCALDAASLAAIAAQGYANGVSTFTVGMPGADMAMLDQIAQSGNTDCNGDTTPGYACDASNATAFVAALNAIRETISDTVTHEVTHDVTTVVPLDCQWAVPTGDGADLSTANVDLTDNTTGVVTALYQVEDPAQCATATEPAWYFDPPPPEAPTKLRACDATCDNVIKAAADSRIDISLGCKPRILR